MDRDVQFFKLLTICEKILETIKWYCPKSIQLVIGKAILGSRDMNLFLIFQCYMFMFLYIRKNTSRMSNHEINLKRTKEGIREMG